MKKDNLAEIASFIKQIVLVLVLLGFGGSLSTECISMNNQPCMVRPTLLDLNLDELHYYPCIISLHRCYGSCNTVEHQFGRMCLLNKIDLNLKVFNMFKYSIFIYS